MNEAPPHVKGPARWKEEKQGVHGWKDLRDFLIRVEKQPGWKASRYDYMDEE